MSIALPMLSQLQAEHAELCARNLRINMTRGLPSPEQLALAEPFLSLPGASNFVSRDGVDWRNYGGLQGMPEVRELLGRTLLAMPPENVAIGENASLALMYDTIAHALWHGVPGSARAWRHEPVIKFLCPAPGYDRHFSLCADFGIEMIPVPMLNTGPDMDVVERLVAADAAIKAMWCVPKFSNPTGAVYSEDTLNRLAAMPTAAPDFRVLWDNAYAVHDLEGNSPNLEILDRCAAAGHADRVFGFASTSKLLMPGAGLAVFGSSAANLAWWLERRKYRTIGPDKVNQLRHLLFFRDGDGLLAHMRQHGEIVRPRFERVVQAFDDAFAGTDIARWTRPKGGYFISLDTPKGCARRTVELAQQAGIAMTPAGATYPLGRDPDDSNLRIAPTYVDLDALGVAAHGIATCVKLAAAERS